MKLFTRIALASALVGGLPGVAAAQGFGVSVAVSGSDVLVGEPTQVRRSGIVYVYRRGAAGSAWAERAQLTPADGQAGNNFGATIAVDGNTAVVGAAPNGPRRPGEAYVFTRDRAGAWTQAAKLERPDSAVSFGLAVAVAGDLVLVGAAGRDSLTGAVYVYRRSGTTWRSAGVLTASDARRGDRFGATVALAGGRAVVSAIGRGRNAGVAYVFAVEGDSLREQARILPSDTTANNRFGQSLAFAGEDLLVGAPGFDRNAGGVFQLRRDSAGRWQEAMILRPFDRAPGKQFGASLAFDGSELWVGAPVSEQAAGRVYRVRRDAGGSWTDVTRAAAPTAAARHQYGRSLALGGGVAVVGATGEDEGAGAAYVLERSAQGQWAERGRVVSRPDYLPMVRGGERNCEGGTAAQFSCRDVDLLSFLPLNALGAGRGTRLSGNWGWTDSETGREYVLVGRTDATAFVDVTNPANPIYVGELPRTEGAFATSWREIKVYRNYALIVSDGSGPHGVQFFDLTQLRGVRNPPVRFQPTVTYREVASVHNIVVNEESGFAYAVGSNGGGQACGGGLHMIDIREPTRPRFVGCFTDTQAGRGYTHDALCVNYRGPDVTYRGREICLSSNERALSIQDVTEKNAPRVVSRATYPNVAYTHQGWFTEDQRYFYVNDEGDEFSGQIAGTRTLVWDLQDLDDPVLAHEYIASTRAVDHNLYVRGNLMFQSNYTAGLRVLDVSEPARPREVGFIDTYPWGEDTPSFAGTWNNYPFFRSGTVAVTGIGEGLFVVRYRPSRPVP